MVELPGLYGGWVYTGGAFSVDHRREGYGSGESVAAERGRGQNCLAARSNGADTAKRESTDKSEVDQDVVWNGEESNG